MDPITQAIEAIENKKKLLEEQIRQADIALNSLRCISSDKPAPASFSNEPAISPIIYYRTKGVITTQIIGIVVELPLLDFRGIHREMVERHEYQAGKDSVRKTLFKCIQRDYLIRLVAKGLVRDSVYVSVDYWKQNRQELEQAGYRIESPDPTNSVELNQLELSPELTVSDKPTFT